MADRISLSGVPKTMLQTLYARAEASRTRGAIHDEAAEALVSKLDYDFSIAKRDNAMRSGVIARTIVLDKLTKAFLASHPGAVVVNIACGLDTRCYRMTGFSHWYNLDLPETMAVREKLLPEKNETISQLAMSAMDDWGAKIAETNAPALIIIEGLTMYLAQTDVQQIFRVISGQLPRRDCLCRDDEPHGRPPLSGKVHRGQRCALYLGREGWGNARRTSSRLPLHGGARLNRRHGGLRSDL